MKYLNILLCMGYKGTSVPVVRPPLAK